MKYIVGLDLGQAADYTAVAVLEVKKEEVTTQGGRIIIEDNRLRTTPDTKTVTKEEYHVRHLQRYPLGTSYPEIVRQVRELLKKLKESDPLLVVDATGVGRAVLDLLTQAGLQPYAVTITGGDEASHAGRQWRVPKRDLVAALTVAFQNGKLKIAAGLPDAKTLVDELLSFKVKINLKTAHDSYEAWREGAHDDLVLAVALAAWGARTLITDRNLFSIIGFSRRW